MLTLPSSTVVDDASLVHTIERVGNAEIAVINSCVS
jgi:hypothetical protein